MRACRTKIAMLLSVAAMMLTLLAAPVAMADSTRVCNNRCGDVDQSTTIDNSTDNDVTNTTNQDNDVTNNNTTNTTTKTCGTVSGNNSSCNIS
jgi:hypothetical protein